MKPVRTLGADAKWVILGRLAQGGAQILLVVALAQLNLIDVLADYSLAQAMVLPLFTALQVALRNLVATERYPGSAMRNYYRIQVPASLLFTGCLWALSVAIYPEEQWVIAAFAAARACDSASEVAFGLKQSQGRFKEIAVSSIVRATAFLALCSTFAASHLLALGLAVYSIASLTIFLAFDRTPPKSANNASSASHATVTTKDILIAGVPLGLAMGISTLVSQSPRFFMQRFGSELELAVLMAIFQLTLPAVLSSEVIRTVFLSELSNRWQRNIQHVPRILATEASIITLIGIGYLCVVAISSDKLLALLYGEKFSAYGDELTLLMIATLPRLITGIAYDLAVAQRKTTLLLVSDIATLLLVVVGCITLVPTLGLRGAVASMAAAGFCQMVILLAVLGGALRKATADRRSSGTHWPDFLIIGAQRSGTSWLDAVMRTHPSILLPERRKEIHFFDLFYSKGLSWYGEWFPFRIEVPEGGRVGEATPEYILWPEIPTRIQQAIPNCKFILIVRNPADRAFSQYLLTLSQGGAVESFEDFLAKWPTVFERGRYAEQFGRYLTIFPKDRFLILIYEKVFSSPANTRAALDAIARHINVSPGGFSASTASERIGRVVIPRFLKAFRLGKKISVWLRVRDVEWPMVLFHQLRTILFLKSRSSSVEPMSPAQRRALLAAFEDDIKELERLTGFDLDIWRSAGSEG